MQQGCIIVSMYASRQDGDKALYSLLSCRNKINIKTVAIANYNQCTKYKYNLKN